MQKKKTNKTKKISAWIIARIAINRGRRVCSGRIRTGACSGPSSRERVERKQSERGRCKPGCGRDGSSP